MTRLQRIELFGTVFGIVFGTLLHFTYAWFGRHFFIGLFSAINESVWEHTKLIVTPVVIFGMVEWRTLRMPGKVLKAKAVELLFGVLFIIAFFYTYTGALGIKEILAVDITAFIVAVLIGKYISYRIIKNERFTSWPVGIASAGVVLMFLIMQAWFTFTPPGIPLFEEHEAAVNVSSSANVLSDKQRAIASLYPEFKDFTDATGFAGHEIRSLEDNTDHYFAYLTLGSGVPIAQATCFRVDRQLRIYQVGEFPDPLDQVAGYTDVDPKTCRGLNPPL